MSGMEIFRFLSAYAGTPSSWWALIAVVLLILEAGVPGGIMGGIAFAALLTAGLVWLSPELALPWQIMFFGGSSGLALWLVLKARKFFNRPLRGLNLKDDSTLWEKPLVAASDFIDGGGHVWHKDRCLPAYGPDLRAGPRVRAIGVKKDRLLVEIWRQ